MEDNVDVFDVGAMLYEGEAADRGRGLMALLVARPLPCEELIEGEDVVVVGAVATLFPFVDELCTLLL